MDVRNCHSQLLGIILGLLVFAGCSQPTASNPAPAYTDGLTYSYTDSTQTALNVSAGLARTGNVLVPASYTYFGVTLPVTQIADYAFSGCTGLTGITLPSSITYLGASAFYGCSSLSSITIPPQVTAIQISTFSGSGLTSVTIPTTVTSIGNFAFYNCIKLTSASWLAASGSLAVGTSAFQSCTVLASVTLSSATPPVLATGSLAFSGEASGFKIHVPTSGAETAYQAATGWIDFYSAISYP